MTRVFKHFDCCKGERRVTKQDLYAGLKELGVNITKQEAMQMMNYLDKNGEGYVNYEEFLIGLRVRQDVVDEAFKKIDKNGNGTIEMNEVKMIYNAKLHPKVIEGKMIEEEVCIEFLRDFADANSDGKICKKEWDDHYAAISSLIDEDQMFVGIMKELWEL